MILRLGLVAVALFAAACSIPEGSDPGFPAGDAGARGGGEDAASENDGPPAQGAFSAYLQTQLMQGTVCPAGQHWVNVPSSSNAQQTSATARRMLAIDGENGMSVACWVYKTDGKFFVQASLRSPATDPTGNPINPTTVSFATIIPTKRVRQASSRSPTTRR
jgi:hypothetical protein